MASNSETGHAKNVANFQDLTSFVGGYGPTYNPAKATLKLPALITSYTFAYGSITDVVAKNTLFNNAVNDRVHEFSDIRSLGTRIVSALEATDASPEKIKDAKGFNRKLQGRRASGSNAAATPAEAATLKAAGHKKISTSQQSYDQLIEHFSALVSVVKSEPSYAPNEADLKIPALNTKIANLITKNKAVADAYTEISNARIVRDKKLYATNTGIVKLAADVKKYVKSVYGASSAEFAQIKGIKFTTPKK